MLQHNLLIAFRNLQRHKGSFIINLLGLSTGLACAFLIFLWVQDELHFDRFHAHNNRLYQVMEVSTENGNTIVHEATQGLLAESMDKDLPEVAAAVPVFSLQKEGIYLPMSYGEKSLKASGIFAGKDFFNLFSFPLVQGNTQQVLADKNAIVISEGLAASLFGSAADAMGKTIQWEILGNKKQSLVSGVFAQLPANNSLHFDFALSYDMLLTDLVPNFKQWWNEGPVTYLLLQEGTNIEQFNQKIAPFVKNYFKESIFSLFVRPYSSAYLYGRYENGQQAGGRIEYVKLFSLIAIFILVIACINFMNLATAKASRRLKEVGIKKTLGSSRKGLILQFLTEALLMAFLSLFVAATIVSFVLPLFNQLTGKQLDININPLLAGVIIGATVFTGFLAGSYPAFYLSGFQPISVLKGRLKTSLAELLARKGLVVFQFTISLVLIIAVLVIYRQLTYVQSKNLGYNKDGIIYFDKEGASAQNMDGFLAELRNLPGIVNASAMQQGMVQTPSSGASTYGIEWPGKTDKDLVDFVVRAVDYQMLEMLDIPIKDGRPFSKGFGAEDTKLIFNEAAIKAMGLKNPVGTRVKMWGMDMSIIGVAKDFHVSSLHEPIAPLVFMYRPQNTSTIMAKLERGREKETLGGLQAFYKKHNPGYVFEYQFLDEAYQAQYLSEQRVSVLSRFFAGLAILISCLGLFGLAAFNAEIRTKEIGIRKVLGASVGQVMVLLSKDFIRLMIIAILIAFPLAWWAMNSWLSGYAYRINLSADMFIIAGISLIAVALLTVSYQSFRSALANPVKSLRTNE